MSWDPHLPDSLTSPTPRFAEALDDLLAAFPGSAVLNEPLPAGTLRTLPDDLEAIRQAPLLGWLSDDPARDRRVELARAIGADIVCDNAIANGFAWAACDVCGEPILRERGDAGRTSSGKLSKAMPNDIGCKMTLTRNGDGAIVHCPGRHRAGPAK